MKPQIEIVPDVQGKCWDLYVDGYWRESFTTLDAAQEARERAAIDDNEETERQDMIEKKIRKLAAVIELLEETTEHLTLRINKLKEVLYDLQTDTEILSLD